ncbi:MAG TPA: ParB/RepB/Spo0J family partition protein [Pedobacter sp.]|uniref:ParB/RepB/Spo0J family partition protein n=1 Tax=Pedobacter sp. TaxID=1411316 RepID=UPI002BC13E10|nr:ParB/RepB/Spo0J family partition protein [Pedobacter sp.]HMI01830.1 ParB/RepB/Spo0J family partition protein [Pedobacter sp.]
MAKKKQEAAAVVVPVMEYIEIGLIRTSPLNPRKSFDESELQELAESIKKLGVIQSITVRNHPDGGYELICGERRYRASLLAGLAEIPASIRDLSDSEAMELMVTENLQRKDVHPLEEAEAFQYMLDKMGYDIASTAARVAKPESYVSRRLQLTKLIPELKDSFKSDKITIGHADLLCRIDVSDQQYWNTNNLNGFNGAGTVKELKNHLNYRVEKKLATAQFDTTIPFAETIACSLCPANSAYNSSLFPDKAENAICHNSACFNRKTETKFTNDLEEALTNPNILLVETYGSDESGIASNLKKQGHHLYKDYRDCRITKVSRPKEQVKSEYDLDDYDDQEELDLDFISDTDSYNEDLKEFLEQEEEILSGSSDKKKAFIVCGNEKGKYTYITLTGSTSVNKTSADDPDAAAKEQISNIKARQRRGYELDQEKLHKRLVDHIKELPIKTTFNPDNIMLDTVESALLITFAYQHCGYQNQTQINKLLGFDGNKNFYHGGDELIEAIKKADLPVRSFIVRSALYSHFCGNPVRSVGSSVIFELARNWDMENYQKMFDEQEAIKNKRDKRAEERITALEPKKEKPVWRDLHKITNDD